MKIVKCNNFEEQMELKPVFAEIIREVFTDFAPGHVEPIIFDFKDHPYETTFALMDGDKVAGIYISKFNTLEWLLVKPEYRRTGAGKLMLDHFESSQSGIVRLFTYKDNPYIGFYSKNGYNRTTLNSQAYHFWKEL